MIRTKHYSMRSNAKVYNHHGMVVMAFEIRVGEHMWDYATGSHLGMREE